MNTADDCLRQPVVRRTVVASVVSAVATPRFAVYLACVIAAVLTNALVGKDMMWDTLNYHLYAGFSALHDRFANDYFAAGPQSYFNPYIYVPFYLLATSKLPAIVDASVLAIVQSGMLWLTYELALEIMPADDRAARVAAGACAAALALANPILIGELGSSYTDVLTAELVLAGWLVLIQAIRSPSWIRVLGAGLLLGAASALKLTNSAHALCASVLVLFLPSTTRGRLRYLAGFGAAVGLGFLVVAAPWAIRLEHHFGNPFFPLLNDVFRSPQFSTGSMLDYRFIPDSVADALWLPFALLSPTTMVDNELASPDLRYALLVILGAAATITWVVRRPGAPGASAAPSRHAPAKLMLTGLCCAFLADWVLWLRASANGRYFLPMACVAGALIVVSVFRLFADPKLRYCLLGAILFAQAILVATGAEFRYSTWWDGGPWFEVSIPKDLPPAPSLYFAYDNPSNAFLAPFLPRGSGLVNIDGAYELGPDGANGEEVRRLIRTYAPHLQVLMLEQRMRAPGVAGLTILPYANDALEAFGLRAEAGSCMQITVGDARGSALVPAAELPRSWESAASSAKYVITCHVVPEGRPDPQAMEGERTANVVFDRLEDACPELFQPSRPVTRNYSTEAKRLWIRRYAATNMVAIVGPAGVMIASDARLGAPQYVGSESDWQRAPLRLECGRRNERYYARVLPGSRMVEK